MEGPGQLSDRTETTAILSWPDDGTYTFKLGAPDADSTAPFVIAVLGDPQNNPGVWRGIIKDINADPAIKYVVVDGDWSSTTNTVELMTGMLDIADQELTVPFFGTIGNADLGDGGDFLFQRRIGRVNSSFVYRGFRHVIVDDADASIAPKVRGWIDEWSSRTDGKCRLFHAHIPFYDPVGLRAGDFGDYDEGMAMLAMLKRHDFKHLFFGHLHSHFTGTMAGIPATISGGAGGPQEHSDGVSWHYMRVELDPADCSVTPTLIRVHVEDPDERFF